MTRSRRFLLIIAVQAVVVWAAFEAGWAAKAWCVQPWIDDHKFLTERWIPMLLGHEPHDDEGND